MIPNSLIHEYLLRERIQERHREAQQRRLLACLPKSLFSPSRYLIGRLGTFPVTLGTSMQRVEQQSWPVIENAVSSMKRCTSKITRASPEP